VKNHVKPPADLIARAKFSDLQVRNAHGRNNLLSFLALLIEIFHLLFVPTQGGGMEITMDYTTPESVGIKSSYIQEYIETLERENLSTHNLIIMRRGSIVFEKYWKPFHKDFLHRMYSVTKSFVALAIGFLEQDGLLCLDDPICKYFPDEVKNQTDENMKNQTIRHMLMMATAKPDWGWLGEKPKDRVQHYFNNNLEISRPSGTVFCYDSSGSFVLGALVERITDMELMEYLRVKLFDKIGVSKDAYMLKCPGGHSWGDSALICRPTDLLKTAMFCMNMGRWNGEQLLNEEYITLATSKQIDNASTGISAFDRQGYGYQLWMSYGQSFFFNGMGCQLALCIPEKDMIMVYNGDNQGNAYAKKIIIDNFFDIVVKNTEDNILKEDKEEQKALADYAYGLKLFAVRGKKHANVEGKINGVTYLMDKNPMGITKIKLLFDDEKGKFCYENEQGYKEIPFGMCENIFSKFPQEGYSDEVGSQRGNRLYDCAASAAWVSDYQLFIKVQIIDTYFGVLNINLGFRDDGKIGMLMDKTAEDFLNEYQGFAGGNIQKEDDK